MGRLSAIKVQLELEFVCWFRFQFMPTVASKMLAIFKLTIAQMFLWPAFLRGK